MVLKATFKRSFFKTFTWRVFASLDTALLTWFFSGDVVTGLKVGGLEVVTKLIIYFLHERAWRIGWKKNKLMIFIILKEEVYTKLLPTGSLGQWTLFNSLVFYRFGIYR